MRSRKKYVVLGTMAGDPYAGMAWMHMQLALGLKRLGHEVRYMELTSAWPYDPELQTRVSDGRYALEYLDRVAARFGMQGEWAYCRTYLDREWFGMSKTDAENWLKHANAVFNVAGASEPPSQAGFETGPLVYFGTDPVLPEIAFANGYEKTLRIVRQHDVIVTYGENIGSGDCPIPPLPGLKARTRQPVVVELWQNGAQFRDVFTTVANWRQPGCDIEFEGRTYLWSKHHEFLKFLAVPRLAGVTFELATNLVSQRNTATGADDPLAASGPDQSERALLTASGWKLADGQSFSLDPWQYRQYLIESKGEFTVARDMHVRLRSGWFSERSACYLAAGRPVVTQSTGFANVLPVGKGLFEFRSTEEAVEALRQIQADYTLHSRAARQIAADYFRAEVVLQKLLSEVGL